MEAKLTSLIACIVSIATGLIAITIENIDLIAKVMVGSISFCSGIMAIRYYHYAAIEKKESIKKLKNQ